MTEQQYLDSEVYKFLRFQFPEKTMLEVLEIQNKETEYSFYELEADQVYINVRGNAFIFGWGVNGLFSLNDEDRTFDEHYQVN